MSEGKGQIIIAHRPFINMGINGKSCCPVGNLTSNSTCVSQALTQENLCQSFDMLKFMNGTHEEPTTDSCDAYLPWRRFEPSDVQLDFHRPCSGPRFSLQTNEFSIGRTCTNDSDHDSMKCLNTCCYRLPTLPEGVSVCEVEQLNSPVNASSPIPRVPSGSDVLSADVIPPPWKVVETEIPEPVSAGQHSSRTQSEQNSGPLYITDSTCHCTWTGTGAAHYRGSRRNSLVPTATGSSRRRCSQQVSTVERVSIFDGDDDDAQLLQGRAERSWSWLLECPMTAEDNEVRTRRSSSYLESEGISEPAGKALDIATGDCLDTLTDDCLLPTAQQLLLARSHSACDLTQPVEYPLSSWPHGDQLRKSASVPNLAFI